MNKTKIKEIIGQIIFITAAVICIIAVAAIFIFMLVKSFPAFKKIGVFAFVFGENWSPDRLDVYTIKSLSGSYGIFKMILGTLSATVGALAIGGTLGFFTAVFLVFYCPKKYKDVFIATIHLLAGIPSVVYGFFGVVFLLPIFSTFAPNNGVGLLSTSIILGIMILPTVVALCKTSLEAAPRNIYEGALALGTKHSRAVFGATLKASRSGILAAFVLGVGRALGETMAVVMVSGNSVAYPESLFNSFRVMTANIVMEMGYAGEVQQGALVATGVILLLFILIINLFFGFILRKGRKKEEKGVEKKSKTGKRNAFMLKGWLTQISAEIRYKIKAPTIGAACSIGAGIVSAGILVLVIGFIFAKGLPYLINNPKLLFGKYKFDSEEITIFPAFITTLMTVLLSLALAIPIGIGTAVFLNEYAEKDNSFVRLVCNAIDLLNGVPSIVYGLFGLIAFVPIIKGVSTILAGSLTVSIMLLPTIVRSTEESLKSVQEGLREGSLALGAGKLRTVLKIVLPSAVSGILSSILLSMGRVVSESAPFLYTMGSVISAVPKGYLDSNATLAVALYRLAGEGWYVKEAYATAVVLIILVFLLNMLMGFIVKKFRKKI